MRYHLLRQPLGQAPNGNIVWELQCGSKVSLQPNPAFKPGTVVQSPDNAAVVTECPGCYAGEDLGNEIDDRVIRARRKQEEENATLDEDIGGAEDGEHIASVTEDETLKEDDDPYGESQINTGGV